MGTFVIKGLSLSSGGTSYIDGPPPGGPPPTFYSGWLLGFSHPGQTLIQALYDPTAFLQAGAFSDAAGPRNFSDTLVLNSLGSSIYLDGSLTPVSFAGLPAGFIALSAKVTGTIDIGFQSPPDIISSYHLHAAATTGPLNVNELDYNIIDGFPTMLDLYTDGFGIDVLATVTNDNAATVQVFNLVIEGTYELQKFRFELQTNAPLSVGQTTVITSPEHVDNTLDLKQIDQITVTYTTLDNVVHTINIPSTNFLVSDEFHLEFTMPNFGNAPFVTIDATGTQFSGSVRLGQLLTINFVDGTGIYRLVEGKTADTLYIQDYTPFQTLDVKIPNPFAKTGFVP